MNVHPGGKQPKMHDTVMPNGELQSMVDSDGVPKGLKGVLLEEPIKGFIEERPAVYTYLVKSWMNIDTQFLTLHENI